MLLFLLALYLWTLPFGWALSPAPGVDLALSRLLAAGIILIWLAEGLRSRRLALPAPLPLFLVSGFLCLAAASLLWSADRGWAFRKALFLWNFFPLLLVFAETLWRKRAQDVLATAFVGGAAFAAVVGLIEFSLQFVFGPAAVFSWWVRVPLPFFLGPAFAGAVAEYPSLLVNVSGTTLLRASAFFPDPHMFSLYLALALPIGLFLCRRPAYRPWCMLAAGLIFCAELATFSRGGYLAAAAGIGAFFLLQSGEVLKKNRRALLIALLLTIFLLMSPVGTRLFSSASLQDGSNQERLRLWREALGHIVESPFLGVGLGNYPLLVDPTASYRDPIYAHNLFLDLSVEIGLLGSLAFFLFLLLLFRKSLGVWLRTGDFFVLALFSSLAAFFVHALFESPLYSVEILPIFLFLAGAILALEKKPGPEDARL